MTTTIYMIMIDAYMISLIVVINSFTYLLT